MHCPNGSFPKVFHPAYCLRRYRRSVQLMTEFDRKRRSATASVLERHSLATIRDSPRWQVMQSGKPTQRNLASHELNRSDRAVREELNVRRPASFPIDSERASFFRWNSVQKQMQEGSADGIVLMISHCANSKCAKPLHYLREGRLFAFEVPAGNPDRSGKRARRIEHYWLCGTCSLTMEIRQFPGGMKVVPRRQEPIRENTRTDSAIAS